MKDRVDEMAEYLVRERHVHPAEAQDAAEQVVAAVDELRNEGQDESLAE